MHELIKSTSLLAYSNDDELVKDIDNFTYLVYSAGELIRLDKFYYKVWPRVRKAFDAEITKYASLIKAHMSGTVGRLRLIHKYNCLLEQTLRQPLLDQGISAVGY